MNKSSDSVVTPPRFNIGDDVTWVVSRVSHHGTISKVIIKNHGPAILNGETEYEVIVADHVPGKPSRDTLYEWSLSRTKTP